MLAGDTINNIESRDDTREEQVRSVRWPARGSYVLYITYHAPVYKNVSGWGASQLQRPCENRKARQAPPFGMVIFRAGCASALLGFEVVTGENQCRQSGSLDD